MEVHISHKIIDTYLRRMLVEQDYYTEGSNEDYAALFKKLPPVGSPVTEENLLDLAKDIREHSYCPWFDDCTEVSILEAILKDLLSASITDVFLSDCY